MKRRKWKRVQKMTPAPGQGRMGASSVRNPLGLHTAVWLPLWTVSQVSVCNLCPDEAGDSIGRTLRLRCCYWPTSGILVARKRLLALR